MRLRDNADYIDVAGIEQLFAFPRAPRSLIVPTIEANGLHQPNRAPFCCSRLVNQAVPIHFRKVPHCVILIMGRNHPK
jgi:hypothetical protein